VGRSPHSGVFDLAGVSQGGRGGFTHEVPHPGAQFGVGFDRLLELEGQLRRIVAGEEPEEEPVCETEGSFESGEAWVGGRDPVLE